MSTNVEQTATIITNVEIRGMIMSTNVEHKYNKFPKFQKRFNELRGSMSQVEFAKKIGVSTPTVGFYENGNRVPDALTLQRIAEVHNVSVDYLLGNADCKSASNEEISKAIGLSEEAINKLRVRKDNVAEIYTKGEPSAFDILNHLLSGGHLDFIIFGIIHYCDYTIKANEAVMKESDELELIFPEGEYEKIDNRLNEKGYAIANLMTIAESNLFKANQSFLAFAEKMIKIYAKEKLSYDYRERE